MSTPRCRCFSTRTTSRTRDPRFSCEVGWRADCSPTSRAPDFVRTPNEGSPEKLFGFAITSVFEGFAPAPRNPEGGKIPLRTKSPGGAVISGVEDAVLSSKRNWMPKLNFRSIPEQISKVRERCPQSIALSYGDRQLSYGELDDRADRFAGHLAQLGVVSGGTVAVCMERSFDWIVAALGIMRAGAAYVPLDSAWPDSRLRLLWRLGRHCSCGPSSASRSIASESVRN